MQPGADHLRRTVYCASRPFPPVDSALNEVIRPLPEPRWPGDPGPPFLAVVHTADDIRFSASSSQREELVGRLAEYVSRRANDQLWPSDADRVRALFACGQLDAAISSYFTAVGQRWDKEWLVTSVVADRAP